MTIKEFKILREIVEQYKDDTTAQNNAIIKYLYPSIKLSQIEEKMNELATQIKPFDVVPTTFKLDGVVYGMIPNFDEITAAEFLDLSIYENDQDKIENVMSIIYRPVIQKIGNSYKIEEYKGSQTYAKQMLNADIRIYQTMIAFFLTINEQLLNVIPTYLKKMKPMEKKK